MRALKDDGSRAGDEATADGAAAAASPDVAGIDHDDAIMDERKGTDATPDAARGGGGGKEGA